ncbi:putative serine/threonine protein kinase IREH1, partial [Mucuna pruriens]
MERTNNNNEGYNALALIGPQHLGSAMERDGWKMGIASQFQNHGKHQERAGGRTETVYDYNNLNESESPRFQAILRVTSAPRKRFPVDIKSFSHELNSKGVQPFPFWKPRSRPGWILEKTADNPGWQETIEDLLVLARTCAMTSSGEFWLQCEGVKSFPQDAKAAPHPVTFHSHKLSLGREKYLQLTEMVDVGKIDITSTVIDEDVPLEDDVVHSLKTSPIHSTRDLFGADRKCLVMKFYFYYSDSGIADSEIAQLSGSSVIQPGQRHLSLQLQQRRENPLVDRHKASVGSSTDVKPMLSSLGQSSVLTPSDASSTNKLNFVQLHSTVSTSSMLSSPGIVRPSHGATSTRFRSALNIETLVAAAEKRETPIEALGSEVQDKISFIINNIFVANIEAKAKELTEILKELYYCGTPKSF